MIKTNSLAKLPRDLLQVPLCRDVLTEDFVFYYEQNEGRLSLMGTLRRIAYEHGLNPGDWVIRAVVDEPAEVVLWKGPNGRLTHYLVAISRNYLARLVEMAAKVALNDKQLKIEANLLIKGEAVPIYALTYGYKRTLFFVTQGDRMVILSDGAVLKDRKGVIADTTRKILSGLLNKETNEQRIYQDGFRLSEENSEHSIVATARYLSFGYQRFFPSIQALRFDFGKNGWSTHVMFDPNALPAGGLDTVELWNMVPSELSVCVALPVDWYAAAALLYKLGAKEQEVRGVVGAIKGPGGVCWYPKSHLHTPLFVLPIKRPLGAGETTLLAKMFETVIGTQEPSLKDKGDARFPVMTRRHGDLSLLWQREVTSPYGPHRANGQKESSPTGGRFFRVTLAYHKQSLFFSPDDELVQDALAVADKKFPALGDTLPDGGSVIAVVKPASLITLLEGETMASLPSKEPVLRSAARARLFPRLAALKKYPSYGLVLPPNIKPTSNQWLPVAWQPLEKF
jgi:uncharacterized protein YfaA (DUF2138 family)